MRYSFMVLVLTLASPVFADEVDNCIQTNVEISAVNPEVDIDAVGYDLTIRNNLQADLGGAIIRYELWSLDRPIALAKSYAQFAHTLRGGLLSGETATLREYIGLSERAMELAKSASNLKIVVELENVADLKMQPLGSSGDPFALWEDERSTQFCERRPE